jgi:hypothetical protein
MQADHGFLAHCAYNSNLYACMLQEERHDRLSSCDHFRLTWVVLELAYLH